MVTLRQEFLNCHDIIKASRFELFFSSFIIVPKSLWLSSYDKGLATCLPIAKRVQTPVRSTYLKADVL